MMKILILGARARYETYLPALPFIRQQELVFLDRDSSEEEILARAADAGIIFADAISPVPGSLIRRMPELKLIQSEGVAYDKIDLDAARERGIWVCNVPDYGVDETSNHAIALILALARKLPVIHADVRRGGWGLSCGKPMHRFAGSTLGLVGLGRIASAVARKLSAFGLNMIAYDPYVPAQRAAELGVTLVDFDTLVRSSDYITLHCPATEDNHHLFSEAVFARMKPTAYLINAARGSIVDEAALIAALRAGQIAGAGLDVLEREPIAPDSPLLAMDNVIITSHFGGYSEEAIESLQRKATQEAVNILAGNAPFHAVNGRDIAAK